MKQVDLLSSKFENPDQYINLPRECHDLWLTSNPLFMVQTGCSWFEILYHHVLDILQLLLKSFFHQYVVKFENFVSSDKSQYCSTALKSKLWPKTNQLKLLRKKHVYLDFHPSMQATQYQLPLGAFVRSIHFSWYQHTWQLKLSHFIMSPAELVLRHTHHNVRCLVTLAAGGITFLRVILKFCREKKKKIVWHKNSSISNSRTERTDDISRNRHKPCSGSSVILWTKLM